METAEHGLCPGRQVWLWEAGRRWALGRFGWMLRLQSRSPSQELRRQPPCPQEPRLEAGLQFFRAAPLNELPVPGSTSSSRGGKGCAGQEASPGKQGSVHLPGSFTTSHLSLFSPLASSRKQRRVHTTHTRWCGRMCGCSDIRNVLTVAYGGVCSLTSCVLADPVRSSAARETCPHVLPNTRHGPNVNPHLLPPLVPHRFSPPASPLL